MGTFSELFCIRRSKWSHKMRRTHKELRWHHRTEDTGNISWGTFWPKRTEFLVDFDVLADLKSCIWAVTSSQITWRWRWWRRWRDDVILHVTHVSYFAWTTLVSGFLVPLGRYSERFWGFFISASFSMFAYVWGFSCLWFPFNISMPLKV